MRRILLLLGTALLCSAANVERTDVCLRVLLRALSFDRNLSERVGNEATLLIVYNSRDSESVSTLEMNRAERARLAGYRLGGVDLRIVDVDLRLMTAWPDVVQEHNPDAVLLLPGTDAWSESIATDASSSGFVVLGHGYSADGMAISVSLGEDGRPVVLVDRAVAVDVGMDLSSQLLRLAVLR